jgi:16S rRNA (cytidine1402-2'-O)-methyltransferase
MSGIVLVTLPIGNNKDLTPRAKTALEQSSIIYAEDTRVLREFSKHNDIDLTGKKIQSFHDHTDQKISSIGEIMKTNTIVLVSDAGSPVISDPSFPLVRKALELGLDVKTCPGVSAVIAALELSGLAPSPFHFHSFIPREQGKRKTFFEECRSVYGTHIFFEGVSRVVKSVEDLIAAFPHESFCIARELTKTHESVYRFRASEWSDIKEHITLKGEFVILFTNSHKSTGANPRVLEMANQIIEEGAHPKKLSKLLSEITGTPTKEIYQNLIKK